MWNLLAPPGGNEDIHLFMCETHYAENNCRLFAKKTNISVNVFFAKIAYVLFTFFVNFFSISLEQFYIEL